MVPGLLLAYLSFRTIKDERILIERSLELQNEEFVEDLQRLLEKTKESHLTKLQEQLRRAGAEASGDNHLFLATDLLENPLIQSLVIYESEKRVFPRQLRPFKPNLGNDPGAIPSAWNSNRLRAVQEEFRAGRYANSIRLMRANPLPPHLRVSSPLGTPLAHGLRLLEIKSLMRLGLGEEAVNSGLDFIRDILDSDAFISYHQLHFYLAETISLLTSMENLPRETRDYLWSIYQRSQIFLVNAQYIAEEWRVNPDRLLRFGELDALHPIQLSYFEGLPYIVIGYPWLEKETHIIARLNETVFSEAVRAEILLPQKGPWKDVEFSIYNQAERLLLSSESVAGRELALEKTLDREFPAWKVAVFKKKESEVAALGRRKLTLLYTLLAFSLIALLLGSISLFLGLRNEKRTVRMKTNFLSAVSHELKTPLTSIRMFAEILESGKQPAEAKRKRYAQMIGEESMRLHAMIEDILNFTRLEEKRAQWDFTPVNLTTVVQEVAGLMAGAFEKAGITLMQKLDPDATVNGDRDALRSVVQNLLENALKYSRSVGTVTVTLQNQPDQIQLSVKDQGIGISGADQKHIFDKFYRGGDEMTRKTKGSGLGLAIVKQILDAHHAEIRVNSKLDEGTEMVITFAKGKMKSA